MKFDRAALAQAVKDAQAAHLARFAEESSRLHERHAKEQAEWMETHKTEWAGFANLIRRNLGKGKPVLARDIPGCETGYSRSTAFTPSSRLAEGYKPPAELAALLRVLETIADDTVTSAGLRDLGITDRVMREVVAMLPAKSVVR